MSTPFPAWDDLSIINHIDTKSERGMYLKSGVKGKPSVIVLNHGDSYLDAYRDEK